MKLILLGGFFNPNSVDKIIKDSTSAIQFAANTYQWNLIDGFREQLENDFSCFSIPFINPFPNGYRKLFYTDKSDIEGERYVGFFNLWGIRNLSRYYHLKNALRNIHDDQGETYVIVYSPHVPLLKAAMFIKKRNPLVHTILLLPDLPQFVSTETNPNPLYKLLKPIDIKSFYNYSRLFDGYILLTKYMNEFVNKDFAKKYLIIEGIADRKSINRAKTRHVFQNNPNTKTIAYTGTLNEKYGAKFLVDAFLELKGNYRLVICGDGDSREYIERISQIDKRIVYRGQVSHEESVDIQLNADILINPRQNTNEFTKYSFPSKNLEYLCTLNPVIAYKLDGIPQEYDSYLFYPNNESIVALNQTITRVASMTKKENEDYRTRVEQFLLEKEQRSVAARIINYFGNGIRE